MKYKSLFIIIGLLFFIGTISVKAEDINSKIINGNNVLVDYDINGSVLISGFNININNKIDGVAFILGDKIDLNSNMSYALISGQDITVNGKITDAFIIGNNIILNESSNIERDIIIYGNNVEISGLINRNVKIVSDNVKIDSVQIAGDITIDSKNIEITDNSAIMGKLSYNKSAKVHISENLNNENIIVYEDNKSNKETIFNYIKNILTKILNTLILFIISYLLVPKLYSRLLKGKDKTTSILVKGILGAILIPLVSILLLLSSIGTIVGIISLILYLIIIYISPIIIGCYIGNKYLNKYIKKENITYLIGILIIKLSTFIPIIGVWILLLAIIYTFGIIISQFKIKRWLT